MPEILICNTCGRSWDNDDVGAPAGRCPWEADHVESKTDVSYYLVIVDPDDAMRQRPFTAEIFGPYERETAESMVKQLNHRETGLVADAIQLAGSAPSWDELATSWGLIDEEDA